MSQNIKDVRSFFPQIEVKIRGKQLVYFDSASTTLKPQSVIDAINDHYYYNVSNIHRGIHYLSELGTNQYEQTRTTIQEFINAQKRCEIIFTKGTTESINLLAFSLGELLIQKDDEILISIMEHHSNIVPWQITADKKSAKIKAISLTKDGHLDFEHFKSLLTKKTKILSLTLTSNTLGINNNLKAFIKLAKENGTVVVIDAAQAVAHQEIDVRDLNCDFLVFSGHKIFGPTGIGILYGREDLLEKMPPYQSGGAMIDNVTIEKTTYADLPHKFEAGTPPIASAIALKPAIEFINSIGFDWIKSHENKLLTSLNTELKKFPQINILADVADKSPVVSFIIDGVHPNDLGTLLDQQSIAVRTGHHCTGPLMDFYNIPATTRVSLSIYNTEEEIKHLTRGLTKAFELL